MELDGPSVETPSSSIAREGAGTVKNFVYSRLVPFTAGSPCRSWSYKRATTLVDVVFEMIDVDTAIQSGRSNKRQLGFPERSRSYSYIRSSSFVLLLTYQRTAHRSKQFVSSSDYATKTVPVRQLD